MAEFNDNPDSMNSDPGQNPKNYLNSLDSSNSDDDDDIGIGKSLKRGRATLSLKGVGLTLLIVVLIIGSFWASFFIGKRVLSPVKNLPEIELQKEDANTLPSAFSSKAPDKKEEIKTVAVPPALKKEAPVAAVPLKRIEIKKEELLPAEKPPVKKEAAVPPKRIEIKKEELLPAEKPLVKKEGIVKEEIPAEKPVVKKRVITPAKKAAAKKAVPGAKLFRVQVMVADSKENADGVISNLQRNGFEGFAHKIDDNHFSIRAGAFKSKTNAARMIEELGSKGFTGEIITE